MRVKIIAIVLAIVLLPLWHLGAHAADVVKVTPLGGQQGEFCRQDRALLFEDPNGTRLLYDAGRTVAGPKDPRLGRIDVVLVSHVHGDHIGNRLVVAARPISRKERLEIMKKLGFIGRLQRMRFGEGEAPAEPTSFCDFAARQEPRPPNYRIS